MKFSDLRIQRGRLILFSAFILLCSALFAQKESKIEELKRYIYSAQVDSLLSTMSEDERIAQLFWLPVFTPGTLPEISNLKQLVADYQPGGILYFRTDPEKLIDLTNQLQGLSKIPLTVSLDGEWGLGMRLNNTISFPYQMTLGAMQTDSLIYMMGLEVAREFKRMGIHVNFAPVVDVNINPENPVINFRSFGENPKTVSRKALAYMNGMQDGGIMAVAKHFPGHGDTNTDSHKALPLINQTRERLDSVELYPFRKMIVGGVLGIMSGHLEVPALDSVKGRPASLSPQILTDLLRNELQFNGLVISDAMNMNGVKRVGEPGKVDALALIAGNDIIEFTESLPKAILEVHKAVDSSLITWDQLNLKVRRALALKMLLNVDANRYGNTDSLKSVINSVEAKQFNRLLYQNSLTVLSENSNCLPIKLDNKKRTVAILIGDDDGFLSSVAKHGDIETIVLGYKATSQEISKVSKRLKGVDNLIVGLTDVKNLSNYRKARKTQKAAKFISELCAKKNLTLVFFGNPYLLDAVKNYQKVKTILMAYQDNSIVQDVAGNALFGDFGCSGTLPVSIDDKFLAGSGIVVAGGIQYVDLKSIGISHQELPIIDIPPVDMNLVIPTPLNSVKLDSLAGSNAVVVTTPMQKNIKAVKSDRFLTRMLTKVGVNKGDSLKVKKDSIAIPVPVSDVEVVAPAYVSPVVKVDSVLIPNRVDSVVVESKNGIDSLGVNNK